MRWSKWLRLDSETWDVDLIQEQYLGELDTIAERAKANFEKRATPTEMGEIFKRLLAACRGQPGEDQPRAATLALYLRYLCNYPADVLSAAADTWILTRVFMPAISELKALCEAEMAQLARIWRRSEALAGHSRGIHQRRRDEDARKREIEDANAKMTPERRAEIEESVRRLGARITSDGHLAFRHPSNKDTDSPQEKARIARICADARAKAAQDGSKVNARIPPNEAA